MSDQRKKPVPAKSVRAAFLGRGSDDRPLSPCARQTEAEVAAYYRAASEGDAAVVRQTQGHMLQYLVTDVEGCNPQRGRVYIRNFGAFYSKHGKNCYHPTGQTRLVVPTQDVLAWAATHPSGAFGIKYYADPQENLL